MYSVLLDSHCEVDNTIFFSVVARCVAYITVACHRLIDHRVAFTFFYLITFLLHKASITTDFTAVSLVICQGLLTSGYIILLSRVGERVAADMRKTLFASLLRYKIT